MVRLPLSRLYTALCACLGDHTTRCLGALVNLGTLLTSRFPCKQCSSSTIRPRVVTDLVSMGWLLTATIPSCKLRSTMRSVYSH